MLEKGDKDNNILHTLTDLLDRYPRILQVFVTSSAVAGVLVIGRSVRLVTKFHRADTIPKEFIRKGVKLRGKVHGVKNGTILVEHLPILPIPRWSLRDSFQKEKNGFLRLFPAGVIMQHEGSKFLQKTLSDHPNVWFQLLSVDTAGQIEAIVMIRKNLFQSRNINLEILRLGLGRTQSLHASPSKVTKNITRDSMKAELYAEKKRKGIWKQPSMVERFYESYKLQTEKLQDWKSEKRRKGSLIYDRMTNFIRKLFKKS